MSKEKWTTEQMEPQTGRVAVVTGANSGIGYETAKALAQKGATVVLACRDDKRAQQASAMILEEAPDADLALVRLDLGELASVRSFAGEVLERFSRLDLLIENAGVMMPPYGKTADGFELQIGINHLGHFALTGLLMERLLETDGSRVVVVSSLAHKGAKVDLDDLLWEDRPYKKWKAYGQSKLANLLFTYELQRRLDQAGAGTIVTAAHPGWTSTNLQQHVGLFSFFSPLGAMEPWQGALPTLYAATSPEARGGDYFGPHGFKEIRGFPKKVDSIALSHDEELAAGLWSVSEELVGVRFDARAP